MLGSERLKNPEKEAEKKGFYYKPSEESASKRKEWINRV